MTKVNLFKSTRKHAKMSNIITSSPVHYCGYCHLRVGYADHRMCICRGYNYSVRDWELAAGLRAPGPAPELQVSTPPTVPEVSSTGTLIASPKEYKKAAVRVTKEGSRETYRLFIDGHKVSVAVLQKDKSILEVSPRPVKQFATRAEWEAAVLARDATLSPVMMPVTTASTKFTDWTYSMAKKATFPAGRYYIGDLCYVLGDAIYDGIFGGHGYESGLYTDKTTNMAFLVDGTAYGDGCYVGSDGSEFGVDAGIIGICPAALIAKDAGCGRTYTFNEPVECVFRDGVFTFNYGWKALSINTASFDD